MPDHPSLTCRSPPLTDIRRRLGTRVRSQRFREISDKNVRFAARYRLKPDIAPCPLCATSGHSTTRCANREIFSWPRFINLPLGRPHLPGVERQPSLFRGGDASLIVASCLDERGLLDGGEGRKALQRSRAACWLTPQMHGSGVKNNFVSP